jgi:molybdenum cofactor cytidylyltransferase
MRLAALIMAAGAASRFGSCKHLVKVEGKPLLQRQVDHLLSAGIEKIFVVSGAWLHAHKAANIAHAEFIFNPSWQNGLGDSIARGVKHLADKYDGILITLADQAALTSQDYRTLVDTFNGTHSVCAFYEGKRGVPAIFNASAQKELAHLYGDKGAKLFLQNCASIEQIPIPAASIDIDTPDDLKQLHASHSIKR